MAATTAALTDYTTAEWLAAPRVAYSAVKRGFLSVERLVEMTAAALVAELAAGSVGQTAEQMAGKMAALMAASKAQ